MTEKKATHRTIELDVHIDAPLDAVWKALTDATELARWFPPVANGQPGPNEALLLSWGPEVQWHTRVAVWEPEKHLVWRDESAPGLADADAQAMAVDWTLETTAGGQVHVRLVQSGFGEGEAWDDFYDGTDRGWRFFLHALRHYLERHRGTARAMVSARKRARGGPAAPWKRVWGPEGFAPTPDAARLCPGGRVELQLGTERLAATVDCVEPPHFFYATLPGLEDATLLVEMEPGRDVLHCGLWLSTYGLPAERVRALQTALTAMADRAFAGAD